MNINLRNGLVLVSLLVLILIIITVVKRKLNIRYSFVWIVWAFVSLLMAIFPESFYSIADFLGIEIPVNAVFLIMAALLYFLTFYVYIMISKHNEEIIQITYENSLLKKEIENLKKKNEK